MSFLSKAWKGIKTGVKGVGKAIKGAFKSFGKFMGKIGIVGQLAMMFVLPMIAGPLFSVVGSTIGGAWTSAATTLTNYATANVGSVLGVAAKGAASVMNFVTKAVTYGKTAFNSITEGISTTIGEFAKTATNKIAKTFGFDPVFENAAENFFGPGGAASRGKDAFSNINLKSAETLEKAATETADSFASTEQSLYDESGFSKDISDIDMFEPPSPAPDTFKVGDKEFGFDIKRPTTPYTEQNRSLLEQAKDTVTETFSMDNLKQEASDYVANIPKKAGDFFVDAGLTTAAQNVGLLNKPELIQNIRQGFVPDISQAPDLVMPLTPTTTFANNGMYGAPALQTQLSNIGTLYQGRAMGAGYPTIS